MVYFLEKTSHVILGDQATQSSRASKTKTGVPGPPWAEILHHVTKHSRVGMNRLESRDGSQQPVDGGAWPAGLTFRTPVVSNPWHLPSFSQSEPVTPASRPIRSSYDRQALYCVLQSALGSGGARLLCA